MPYTPIMATLGYVLSPDKKQLLMIYKQRPGDNHLGKYNGLGGKLENNEEVAAGMKRELKEEANIDVTKMEMRGTISWPGFGKKGEDWFAFIFLITEFTGEIPKENQEGRLEWQPLDKLSTLPMWEGDAHFLPLIFDKDPRPFYGIMPYHAGKMVSWSYSR